MIKNILIALFFLSILPTYSQILNVDRENVEDTLKKKLNYFVTLNFSNDKQKKNLIDLATQTEIDLFFKNNYFLLALVQTDFAINGNVLNENNGYFQVRYRDNDTRKYSLDFYSQFQWNNIQGLENRFLNGINARINLFEKKKSDLFFSIGSFYEIENWNTSMTGYAYSDSINQKVRRDFFRLNTSAKFALKISDKIDFAGTSYLQFPINNYFNKPRWYIDSKLFFNVSNRLNFVFHYNQNLDFYRALPIDSFYYSISLGINIKF